MAERIDISDQLNEDFFKSEFASKGKILTFQIEDDRQSFKIVRMNRGKMICEVVPVELTQLKEDEILKEVDRGARRR
jgi:hypothetical protein